MKNKNLHIIKERAELVIFLLVGLWREVPWSNLRLDN